MKINFHESQSNFWLAFLLGIVILAIEKFKGVLMMKKIYFASPLFSEMELAFNAALVQKIREVYPAVEVYLPQEQMAINDKNAYADSTMIAQYDTDALLESDLLIAVLDGPIIDVGVASEIGVAYHAEMPILGLYTDSRQHGADNPEKLAALQEVAESQFAYANLYTVGLVKLRGEIFSTSAELLEALDAYLKA